ncbi:TAF5-like RNA polymerase II p300/CBP-associated factor-associated factor 65 kDa subunit 5L [Leptotrombidium deliense]|uniref:TAF5-like RNA polymerase II p300/CBP-associated factor-associated factor 65 kDa subunit 5L n=1 Tax=Leptotrombidium deliense TaxID=299467 RepID=A0A443SI28_9ACAR|nr:TAF5-like RNA polymerase II p300/CBP-associated factor-associated factor 65 kDa subunit 5L [Leptotrombidium deliense]
MVEAGASLAVNDISTKMKIEEAIRKVSEQPPNVSCICLCSVENTNPTCVAVRSDMNYLAAGFESSDIHVWSLTADAIVKTEDDLSSITLSIPRSENKMKSSGKSNLDRKHKCVLRGHSETVYQNCFLPETELLLSCSEDTTLRAWNMSTMSCSQIYSGHDYPIWCLDASNFGFYFASGSKDTTARLWSVDRSYPLRIYAGHTMDVDCVKFHPNCNYLATGSYDKTIRLWSVSDAKMMRIFQGHSGNVHALAFTPDGKILVSAGEDRKIRLWDISSGALIKDFRGHNDTIYSVSINSEQSILASCGLDRSLKLWDLNRILKSGSEMKTDEAKSDLKLENRYEMQTF